MRDKSKAPYSSLGHLEQYLQPGEAIDIRVMKETIEPRVNYYRFSVSILDSNGAVEDWQKGNTISACLKELVTELEESRPLTEDQLMAVARQVFAGNAITERERKQLLERIAKASLL